MSSGGIGMRRGSYAYRILKEPPFRLLVKALCKMLPVSPSTRALWDVSARPNYLSGVLLAAEQAKAEGISDISVVEFGVAGGNGLLCLQQEAEEVERETGVLIKVFGFDNGASGLPDLIGDHRDHPDAWLSGDYPMDERQLRPRLTERTTLVIGNIRDTVPAFVRDSAAPPVGFMAVDVDLYSSTMQALQLLSLPGRRMLLRTFIYFDDVELVFAHRFAGELLAIDEFNRDSDMVKIDRLRGFNVDRPFPEKQYLRMMYVAHDLAGISSVSPAVDRRPLMTHVLR
jgi:hypothetical protein